jgi:predicted amidophosphoribosyltransferase
MARVNPRKIQGNWSAGYALDLHSISAQLLGYNEFGHPEFETQRTELGELLYRLKYKSDETAVTEIVDAAESFLGSWGIRFSLIVPVPPTRTERAMQPVLRIAGELGKRVGVPMAKDAVKKLKQVSELKNVYDFEERKKLLEGMYDVSRSVVAGHRVLLMDDLYRSGATLNAVTEAILQSGASLVYALALTQTRKKV